MPALDTGHIIYHAHIHTYIHTTYTCPFFLIKYIFFICQGHSYLTQLLLPRMIEQQSPSRIVVLASSAHSFGEFQTTDLNYRTRTATAPAPATPKPARTYQGWDAYKQSKAANILFAKALADRLAKTAPYISTVSVHPGVIRTNLWRYKYIAIGR